MPFATTWLQLQIIVQNELREIPFDITYMWNLKCGTNEPFLKIQKHIDIEIRFVVAKGKERNGLGIWSWY